MLEAEQEFYEQRNAAVHRGAHLLAVEATDAFEDARETVAGFVGAGEDEMVWTSNATEGLNLLAMPSPTPARRAEATPHVSPLAPGDELVVTEMEHHANLIPWQELAAHRCHSAVHPRRRRRCAGPRRCRSIIGPATRVLAFSHASNVLGTINPVGTLVAMARRSAP